MKEKKTTKLCRHCKTEIPAGAKVCPNCKKKLPLHRQDGIPCHRTAQAARRPDGELHGPGTVGKIYQRGTEGGI